MEYSTNSYDKLKIYTGKILGTDLESNFESVRHQAADPERNVLYENYSTKRIQRAENIAHSLVSENSVPYLISTILVRPVFPQGYARVLSKLWKNIDQRNSFGLKLDSMDVRYMLNEQISWLKRVRPDIHTIFVSWQPNEFSPGMATWWKKRMVRYNEDWQLSDNRIRTCDGSDDICLHFYSYLKIC